jgi:hypothetical protein
LPQGRILARCGWPVLRIDRRAPIVISSPVGVRGWLNANGCRGDPTSAPPRHTLSSPSNGAYVTPAIFFVDWMRGSVLGSGRFSYARLFHWATKPFSWPNDPRNRPKAA